MLSKADGYIIRGGGVGQLQPPLESQGHLRSVAPPPLATRPFL
jgi:hypothetical protein